MAKRYNTRLEALKASRDNRKKTETKPKVKDYIYIFLVLLIVTGLYRGVEKYLAFITPDFSVKANSNDFLVPNDKDAIDAQYLELLTPSPEPADKDERIEKLSVFLKKNGSPFADKAELIIAEADKYDIGWTKLTAISGIESEYGKRIPQGSFNAWGIGGAGNMFRFRSWEDAIQYVSKLLGEKYKTNEVRGMQLKYCPDVECSPNWTNVVVANSREILK